VEKLIAWVEELKTALDIPASIQAAGVPETEFLAKLDKMTVDAFDDQCTGANPRFPLIAEIKQLLLDSYYGRPYAEAYTRIREGTTEVIPLSKKASA
jgi:acetaldehyde dehydrogenase/alcohol dehydrogenase